MIKQEIPSPIGAVLTPSNDPSHVVRPIQHANLTAALKSKVQLRHRRPKNHLQQQKQLSTLPEMRDT